jgi:hypothetical protein
VLLIIDTTKRSSSWSRTTRLTLVPHSVKSPLCSTGGALTGKCLLPPLKQNSTMLLNPAAVSKCVRHTKAQLDLLHAATAYSMLGCQQHCMLQLCQLQCHVLTVSAQQHNSSPCHDISGCCRALCFTFFHAHINIWHPSLQQTSSGSSCVNRCKMEWSVMPPSTC